MFENGKKGEKTQQRRPRELTIVQAKNHIMMEFLDLPCRILDTGDSLNLFWPLYAFFSSHTVPPSIIKEVSPSSVMCEKQTLCLVSCQATSYIPFNYSWTKDGQVPTGDGIKLMNNSIIVTPRDAQDYGQYVCHATNSFGSTKYQITLLAPKDTQCNDGKYSSSQFKRA